MAADLKLTIDRHEFGIVIHGPIPVNWMPRLCQLINGGKRKVCDVLITRHFGATLAVCGSWEASAKWRKELGIVMTPKLRKEFKGKRTRIEVFSRI